ncbi:MAG: 2Fe-2S iron-sulfur cluster-binding protein [Rhizobiaceae bacterium]
MNSDFYPLTVSETREEIGGLAKSVMFEVPQNLAKIFAWRAGQHLSFRFDIDGDEVRRSYSISSSPASGDPLRITVKRVKGGLVSNHINDTVEAGDVIEVMPPFGGFCLDPGETPRRTHYFFGAGSGITPIYSMLHSVLSAEPHSVAHLIYGNKNTSSIIFSEALDALVAEYDDGLSVQHVLSDPSWLSSSQYWRKGKIDAAAIEAAIAENPPYAQDTQYYVCGPGDMNAAVKTALTDLDVPADRIHMESYGGAVETDESIKGTAARATILLNGQSHSIEIAEGQTVLEAARAANVSPPFSCQSGVCGACMAKLTSGSVHMRSHMALEDQEIAQGNVLTCQSVATTPDLELNYE